jgi:hypothetical protein
MRTILLSSVALVLAGCSPPAADSGGGSEQTAQSTTESTPSPEASAPVAEASAPPQETSAPPTADPGSGGAAEESFNNVPAAVTVFIAESRIHGGNFGLKGTARICGEVPKELNFAGVPAFGVEFYPDTLPGRGSGDTESGKFFLSLTLQSTAIGSPYALVLDTSQPNMGGKAKLTTLGRGQIALAVDGKNERGEIVSMTLTCGPKER